MSLQFVLGKSGGGKTTACLKMMKKDLSDGKNVIFIIPEQLSLTLENEFIKQLSYIGLGREVFSFGRLFYRVYSSGNSKMRKFVDKIGKTMLLSKSLLDQEKNLEMYKNAAQKPAFSGELLKTISEFKRHNLTADALEDWISKLPNSALKIKLSDLLKLYKCYQDSLSEIGSDSEDNLTVLKDLIPSSTLILNSEIYIDSFSGFTPQEFGVIESLLKYAPNVHISLCYDGQREELFSPVYAAIKHLTDFARANGVRVMESINLPQIKRTDSPELLHLEKGLFSYPVKPYLEKTRDILYLKPDSTYTEIEMCAGNILSLCRDKGYRFGEIGVVVSDMDEYAPLIKTAFSNHDIDFFMDNKKGILNHPVTLLILSACDIFINNFSYESVFTYLKTYLTPLSFSEVDVLENYVLMAGIKGKHYTKSDRWEYKLNEDQADLLEEIRRKFLTPLINFREKTIGRTKGSIFVLALKELLIDLALPQRIEEISKKLLERGEQDLSMEYRQIFNLVVSTLVQLELVLGEDAFGIKRFKELLGAGFATCEIGITPPSLDKVMVGTFARSKHQNLKALYILGASDGAFPSSIGSEGIISDSDRRTMEKSGIVIAPDAKKKALEQPFHMYEILTSPQKYLVVSCPLSNCKGEVLRPAMALTFLSSLFPNLRVISEAGRNVPIEKISSPKATFSIALEKMLMGPSDPIWQEVLSWYKESPDWKDALYNMIESSKFKIYAKQLSKEILEELFCGELNTSVTRLEVYKNCPFSYFMEFCLAAKERYEFHFSPPDAGSFVHGIIERFSKELIENNMSWSELTQEYITGRVSSITSDLTKDYTKSLPECSNRLLHTIERLSKAVSTLLIASGEQIKAGGFYPAAYELSFPSNDLPPLTIETGGNKKINIFGKIDRVDTYTDPSGMKWYRIIDYKSGSAKLDLSDVYNGMKMQLLVYSASLRDKWGNPAGVFYLKAQNPLVSVSSLNDLSKVESEIIKSFKLDGLVLGSTQLVKAMDMNINGWSEVIPAGYSVKNDELYKTGGIVAQEELLGLEKRCEEVIAQTGGEILEGNFPISPCKNKGNISCKFCSYESACGFEQGLSNSKARLIRAFKAEEVLNLVNPKGVE